MTFRSVRRGLNVVHRWVAIVLCVPMIVIGLSGSALLLQREILRLSVPAASGSGQAQSISSIIAAAQGAVAPDVRANRIELPTSHGHPASVMFQISRRPARTVAVYVDPVSLKLLGTSEIVRRGPVQQVLANIHERLMIAPRIGLRLVGWIAAFMIFMGLSGLILWWPRKGAWLGALTVRRGARGLGLHLDLHKMVGIWGLAFFLILGVTGLYLVFPQSMRAAVGTVFPSGADAPILPRGERTMPASPDEAASSAMIAVPHARVTGIVLPVTADGSFEVQMEPNGVQPAVSPITVTFDPHAEGVVSIDDPRASWTTGRVLNLQYALHFGIGAGRAWEFVEFFSGLLPLFLAVTGLTVWWKRRRPRA